MLEMIPTHRAFMWNRGSGVIVTSSVVAGPGAQLQASQVAHEVVAQHAALRRASGARGVPCRPGRRGRAWSGWEVVVAPVCIQWRKQSGAFHLLSQRVPVQHLLHFRQLGGYRRNARPESPLRKLPALHPRQRYRVAQEFALSAVLTGTLTALSLLMASQHTTASMLLPSIVTTVCPARTPSASKEWARRVDKRSTSEYVCRAHPQNQAKSCLDVQQQPDRVRQSPYPARQRPKFPGFPYPSCPCLLVV